jgi:hypothetical protein
LDRVPDQSLLGRNYEGANYMTAARGASYALIYCPNGLPFSVITGKLAGETVEASWFNPRDGSYQPAGSFSNGANAGEVQFIPPSSGRGSDWVLALEGHG